MQKRFFFLPLLLFCVLVSAQNTTISGMITDETNGEDLIGASIFIASHDVGTVTNAYGFYSITLPFIDSISVIYSYLGYKPQVKKMYTNDNLVLNIKLKPTSTELTEIVVSAERNATDENVERALMGVIDVPIKLVRDFPAILGEKDVLKVIAFLPGVQSGQEGTTGFFVRGGNADQNLIQLDEATVYNPSHLFGLLSTFNTNALNNITLIKGGFPANYGGRLSSILDISMKEGNNQHSEVKGGIGLLASHLTIEGPLKKDKASFIVSGRRTYFDILSKPFLKKGNKNIYYFYDTNGKINWKVSKKDKIFLSFFTGKDVASYTGASSLDYGIQFGNSTGTLRWNHIYNQKLFSNTSVIYNNYLLNLSTLQGNYYAQYFSGIIDQTIKTEFNYYPNPKHRVKFGGNYIYHSFTSAGKNAVVPKNVQIININQNSIPTKYAHEAAIFVNDEYRISSKISLNMGLRVPYFFADQTRYTMFEPRISTKFSVDESSSIKASYTEMNQFLHLIPSSTATLPTDIWTPTSKSTKPQFSRQFAIGYFKNIQNNEIETSVEVYYKTMENQALFKEGSQLLEQTDVDKELVYGRGWSYGAEFFAKKNYGKLSGWASYTLSWTNQEFKDLNFGKAFPFKYDRRHNFSVVGSYALSKNWSLSGDFVFTSGAAITLPVGSAYVPNGGDLYGGYYSDFTNRNNYRLRNYHRLDLAATYKKKRRFFKKNYESELVISLYNVYSRLNPYFIYLSVDTDTNTPIATQVSLLPIVPGISYNFKF